MQRQPFGSCRSVHHRVIMARPAPRSGAVAGCRRTRMADEPTLPACRSPCPPHPMASQRSQQETTDEDHQRGRYQGAQRDPEVDLAHYHPPHAVLSRTQRLRSTARGRLVARRTVRLRSSAAGILFPPPGGPEACPATPHLPGLIFAARTASAASCTLWSRSLSSFASLPALRASVASRACMSSIKF